MRHKIKSVNIQKTNIFFLFILFFILSLLQGCLLDRLIALKKQACSFEENFKITKPTGGGLSLVALNPLLLDKDITKLTGVNPSEKIKTSDSLAFLYIFRKKDASTGKHYDLSTIFKFAKIKKKFKLEEVFLDQNVTDIFSSKLVGDILKSLCKSQKNIPSRLVTINLEDVELNLLPNLKEVEKILGAHNSRETVDNSNDILTYVFNQEFTDPALKNNINKAIIRAHYNKDTDSLTQVHVRYLRYVINAMFTQKKVTIKVLLSSQFK